MINLGVSAIWVLGITNAFNLIDNMDGLSAGIALISSLYLAIVYLSQHALGNVTVLLILGGALGGFLLFNFYPASIFMGDAGSLFIGFLVASACLLNVTHLSGVSAFLFLPVLILTVPIFDTFFVSVTRRLRGQPISQGGIDHTSHRLVRLGFHERTAVLALYLLSATAGGVAFIIHVSPSQHSVFFLALWFLLLTLFGIHLFQGQQKFGEVTADRSIGIVRRLMDSDSLVFLLDPFILSISYYAAFYFRFVGSVPSGDMALFLRSWPIIVVTKFLCLWAFQIYRRSWWRGNRRDIYLLLQALMLGEILSVIIFVGLARFVGYSRGIVLLDAVISAVLLVVVRQSHTIFRDFTNKFKDPPSTGRRIFLLGTSCWAELTLHFLSDHNIQCLGLIDLNHGSDLGKRIWGLPVLGHFSDLAKLVREYDVREIVLAENEVVPDCEERIHLVCDELQVTLLRIGLQLATSDGRKDVPHFGSTQAFPTHSD